MHVKVKMGLLGVLVGAAWVSVASCATSTQPASTQSSSSAFAGVSAQDDVDQNSDGGCPSFGSSNNVNTGCSDSSAGNFCVQSGSPITFRTNCICGGTYTFPTSPFTDGTTSIPLVFQGSTSKTAVTPTSNTTYSMTFTTGSTKPDGGPCPFGDELADIPGSIRVGTSGGGNDFPPGPLR